MVDAAQRSYVRAFDITLLVAATVALMASGLVSWLLRTPASVPVEEPAEVAFEAA